MQHGPHAGGKRGGAPSTRASDAAERTQAVYFANLKADMLLTKQMHVLKRAENSLVHRIAIDQKILFRRFQAKLRRSRLARARLWGDKDTERELRASDLHVMNTNSGQQDDDFSFLKRLQRRPCLVDDLEPATSKLQGQVQSGSALVPAVPGVTDQETKEFVLSVMEGGNLPPATDRTLHSLSTIGRLVEHVRHASSVGPGVESQALLTPEADQRSAKSAPLSTPTPSDHLGATSTGCKDSPSGTTQEVSQKQEKAQSSHRKPLSRMFHALNRIGSAGSGAKKEVVDEESSEQGPPLPPVPGKPKRSKTRIGNKIRPVTSPAVSQNPGDKPQPQQGALHLLTPQPSPPPRRKSVQSGRARGSIPGSPTAERPSRRPSQAAVSMFEEPKKVDLVALRLKEARSTDLTPKVCAFLQSLLDMDKKERSSKPSAVASDPLPTGPGEDNEEVLGSEGVQPLIVEDADRDKDEQEEGESRKEELKGDRKFDYYATKMAILAASVKRDPLPSMPGTPEEVNAKLVGNTTIKSITLPRLRFDFGDEALTGSPGKAEEESCLIDAQENQNTDQNVLTLYE